MRAPYCDMTLINDPVNLAKFREINPKSWYQPHCFRPAIHRPRGDRPGNPELASDFVFIGTAFKSRVEFFEQLDLDGIDTMLAGNDWGQLDPSSALAKHVAIELGSKADCVHNHEAAELYRNSRIGLNLYRREGEATHENDLAEAMGPREVEQAACQLFFLRDSRPEGDRVLSMLPVFSGPADASEQLHWWLAHDGLRDRRAAAAREAIADRTFLNSAKILLKRLEDL
jgi:hypothetical protein